jgi:hypothetical protein
MAILRVGALIGVMAGGVKLSQTHGISVFGD